MSQLYLSLEVFNVANKETYLDSLKSGNNVNGEAYYNLTSDRFDGFNSQHDGVNTLRRFEFSFMGKDYKFILNPEDYKQSEPARVTVTQTKAGAFVDDFGAGIITISFRGTTGLKRAGSLTSNDMQNLIARSQDGDSAESRELARSKLLNTLSGFEKFKELRDMIRSYYVKAAPGKIITKDNELVFHNYTDGEHWVVAPQQFDLMRSISRPMLYLYEVQLVCLRAANQPARSHSTVGSFGKIDYLERVGVEDWL